METRHKKQLFTIGTKQIEKNITKLKITKRVVGYMLSPKHYLR